MSEKPEGDDPQKQLKGGGAGNHPGEGSNLLRPPQGYGLSFAKRGPGRKNGEAGKTQGKGGKH